MRTRSSFLPWCLLAVACHAPPTDELASSSHQTSPRRSDASSFEAPSPARGVPLGLERTKDAADSKRPPQRSSHPLDLDPGERDPKGWLGYAFDLAAADALKPGCSLVLTEHLLGNPPVAFVRHADGIDSYVWYWLHYEGQRAIELRFRDDRFLEHGERVDMTIETERMDLVPPILQPTEWQKLAEFPVDRRGALLVQPSRRVTYGARYDHRARGALRRGITTLAECEQILHCAPRWICTFADGTRIASWYQNTPTLGTALEVRFAADGTLAASAGWGVINARAEPPESNGGSPRVSLVDLDAPRRDG